MKKKIVMGILLSAILLSIILLIRVLIVDTKIPLNSIKARYITNEHYRYSPVVLNNQLYFPSDFMKDQYENTQGIGDLGHKDEGVFNDIFLLTGQMLVDETDSEITSFKVVNDFAMDYVKADYLNRIDVLNDNLDKYDEYVLCNDSDDKETRIPFEKDYLLELLSEFGEVSYNIDDYYEAEEIYYIYADSPRYMIHERTFDDPIVYFGTIFLKDNKVYYGNLENEIECEWVSTLKD